MKNTIYKILIFLIAPLTVAEPLDIWISSYQDKQYYEDMVRQYKKVDLDFEAEIHAFGFMEMADKLTASIKTGVGTPDIVQLDEIPYSMFLRGEVPFLDLAPRLKKAGLAKDFHPQRLALFSSGDKTYGVPQSLSAYVMYYRKDKFKEMGITPADVDTWETFLAVGKGLAEKGQALMPLDSSFFEVMLRQRGGRLFDDEGNAIPDMDLAVEVLTFLKTLNENGVAIPPGQGSIYVPLFFSSDVMSDEVLCLMGADWYGLDMLQVNAPDMSGQWGIMPLPKWGNAPKEQKTFKSATFAGQALIIYKGGASIDASWEFVKWVMTDTEANVARYEQGNSFPAYLPAWKDKRLLAGSEYFANDSMGKTLKAISAELPPIAMNAKRGQAVFMLSEKYFSAIIHGDKEPAEILQELKAALDN